MRMPAVGMGLVAAVVLAAPAHAAPTVAVDASTVPMPNTGSHRGITVTAGCGAGTRLVGGGGYLEKTAANPNPLPTNGLVLGGTSPSTAASPVDLEVADGATNPATWMTVSRYTGQSESNNEATAFALCATGGPSGTVVRRASTSAINATQEVNPPNVTTATCPAGTRLVGGAVQARNGGQVDDGTTASAGGNLKPLGSYPSDAAGVPAADGATDATSWSGYASAGVPMAADTVNVYALCSTDPATPPVEVARVDAAGPDAQPGTTLLTSTATCRPGTVLAGGGYRVTETVNGTGGLQPQQGYHMRGSFPGAIGAPAADGATGVAAWSSLVQAGGQTLSAGKFMTNAVFAMCQTVAEAATAVTGGAADVTPTGARLTGVTNPGGSPTSFVFEYGTTTSFGSISTPDGVSPGLASVPVSAPVAGLAPNTTYYYRLVATNGVGTTIGPVRLFTTGPGGAPLATTGAAASVTTSGAILSGVLDALGVPTAFTFEYGTTNAFGAITAVDWASAVAGSQAVSLPVTGLAPGTAYRYRLVATNAAGTTAGAVGSFTTSTAPGPS